MINLNPTKKQKVSKENLIGCKIEVLESSNKKNIGLNGIVVKETKNTIDIVSKGEKKRLIKSNIKIELINNINNNKEKKIIDGKSIIKRIEERLKSR